MKEYRMGDSLFSPQNRQFVDPLHATELTAVSDTMDLITGVKDAAGSTVVIGLKHSPVYDNEGHVGSFWGEQKNLQWAAHWSSVVETNGSAAFTIYDTSVDLEKLFEGNSVARFVAKVYDYNGLALYGWIGGVSVSSNLYTFSVYSDKAFGSQNWFQGGSTAFVTTSSHNVEIYRYMSSVSLGSTDTFTEEVPYNEDDTINDVKKLQNLTNGQYMIDYKNGRFLGRKANADDSETITYKTKIPAGATSIAQADDSAFTVGTTEVMPVGFLADETATDSVNEGDVGAARMTLDRRIVTAGQILDDAAFGVATSYVTPIGALADETATDSVDEGDTGAVRMTLDRKLITASNFKEDAAHTSTDYGSFALAVRSDTIASLAGTTGDYTGLQVDETGYLYSRLRGYDAATDSNKTFEVNPLSGQHSEETVLSLSNIAQTTTAYAYIDMDGYRYITIQGDTSGTTPTDVLTVTIEATCQDDGTAPASCFYTDMTNQWFGVASWIDTDFIAEKDTPTTVKYIRVKYTTSTGGGNDADLVVYVKKSF